MKSGKCPKCDSENIYHSNVHNDMNYKGSWMVIKRGAWKEQAAFLIHYVCDDCQYTESYIADDESMKNIREEWTPMNPRKSKRQNDEA